MHCQSAVMKCNTKCKAKTQYQNAMLKQSAKMQCKMQCQNAMPNRTCKRTLKDFKVLLQIRFRGTFLPIVSLPCHLKFLRTLVSLFNAFYGTE